MEMTKIDYNKLVAERKKFSKWVSELIGENVNEENIDVYIDGNGNFELGYGRWNSIDQFKIRKICYKNSSIDMKIELNTETYKFVRMRKQE